MTLAEDVHTIVQLAAILLGLPLHSSVAAAAG